MFNNIYGNDIVLQDGDIAQNANGDIFTVHDYEKSLNDNVRFEGYNNILFSLTDRLFTIKGDNVFHNEYGSDIYNLLSLPNSEHMKQTLQAAIKNSLLEDPRIATVDTVIVEQTNNIISVKANIVLEGSDSVSEFVFPNFVIE